jgi:FkbM family methyltransferase
VQDISSRCWEIHATSIIDQKDKEGIANVAYGTVIQNTIKGQDFWFFVTNPNDHIMSFHVRGLFYEEEELNIIKQYCPNDGVFVDIGANVGNHSINISRFTKVQKIIVFEPNKQVITILKKNLVLNECENVDTQFLGIALGARDTRLKATSPDPNNLGHTVLSEDEAGEVRGVPGDTLLLDEPVRFIKIDVEGMELDILAGLDQTIARWRPNIFIEVWDDKQHPFLDWCASKSYEVIERFQRYPGIQNYMIQPSSELVRIFGSGEEAWFALLQRARALRDINDEKGFVRTALDAFRDRPHRAEALHDLTRYYLGKSRGDLAVLYADAALWLPTPVEDRLDVDPSTYLTTIKELFTIAASYSTDAAEKERGRAICNWLCLSRDVPDEARGLARVNYYWYAEAARAMMPSIRFYPITIDAPDGFKPGNVSITRESDGFVALIRAVNYDLLESGFFDRHGDTSFRQRTLLAHLDEDLHITSSVEVFPPEDLPPPAHIDSIGFEDPRPFFWRGDLWCLSSVRQLNADGRAEMVLAHVAQNPDGHNVLTDWRVLASAMPVQWEKNWIPQVFGDELRFIYSLDPTRILSESGDVLLQERPSVAVENLRGGSQAIAFDGGWLMLVHEWQVLRTRRHYFHRFVWLDENNQLRRLSRRFFFTRIASEFAAGLTCHVTSDRVVVSFGIDDHEPTLAIIDAQDIRTILLDVEEHQKASDGACEVGRLAWEALTLPMTPTTDANQKRKVTKTIDPPEKAEADPIGDIYVINLDLSVDRWVKFYTRHRDWKRVLRFPAIEGTQVERKNLLRDGIIKDDLPYLPGSLGCAISHINLWQRAASENQNITVFEDDVLGVNGFREKANAFMSGLNPNWDIIQWGYNFHQCYLWLDFEVARAKLQFYDHSFLEGDLEFQSKTFSYCSIRVAHSLGLMAYSISPKGARALLDFCLPLRKRLIPFPGTGTFLPDNAIDVAMCGAYASMQAFVCVPPLVIHDGQHASDRLKADRDLTPSGGG